MKSLKEFIAENLEKQVEGNQENANKKTNENNENILQGQTKNKDSDKE